MDEESNIDWNELAATAFNNARQEAFNNNFPIIGTNSDYTALFIVYPNGSKIKLKNLKN